MAAMEAGGAGMVARMEITEELEIDAASWLMKALLVLLEWEEQRMELVQIANSACSYTIALEATLRSVEEAQYEGQPFPDRDGKLTRQFMRGLGNEEVYHRLVPMKPRILSIRELQAELHNLARESRKFQTQPKAKKAYAQAQFTTASGNQSGENPRTEKANRQNSELTELTGLVKKLVSSQEDQIDRLTQVEARVGAPPPQTVLPQPQRSQTVMTDEEAPAEKGAETRQDLNV
ncbi:transient receptor potential cation channel subfamily V member 5-like protein [Labeo rohita]|uniref:Transient receptor potential cation channel subfamily V member 5-like protein n=1 Tax=Labeo rohita TaxID=84645 RepID=A0A498MGM9_LABRO|nr:transient receptor potential cation channel subfamily V member 5-like protein [Labeo rohita]